MRVRLKKALFGLIVGLLSAVMMAEIGTRVMVARGILPNRMPADLFASNPVGWALEPGLHARIFSTNGMVDISVNEDGFRDKNYAHKHPAGRKRILVLGDSFTLALETPQNDVFHVRMEKGDVDIISTGVSGYGPAQEYLVYQTIGREYDPDAVLMMLFIGNDLMGTEHWSGLPYYSLEPDGSLTLHNFPYHGKFNLPLVAGQRSTWIMRHSMTAFLIGSILRGSRQSNRVESSWCDYEIAESYPDPSEDDWRITEGILLALRDAVEADGKEFRVAVIPTELQVEKSFMDDFLAKCSPPDWAEDYQVRLDAFLAANQITYLDLVDPLRAARQTSDGPLYLPGTDIHWTSEGHAAAARILANWLGLEAP